MEPAATSSSSMCDRAVVLEIWRDVLEVEDADDDDSFFNLGGDSLLAMEFTATIEERLGVEVPLGELFDRPTFGAVVDTVIRARTGG